MSLVGTLHDLGLGEILQIVSLSRKSGLLSLSRGETKAELLFRTGEVIRASSTEVPGRLGELLLIKGVVDPPTLKEALAVQKREGYARLLGVILIELGVSPEAIEEVVRGQIEQAVFALFDWEEGNFEFDMREVEEGQDSVRLNPLQFLLDRGVSPQYLAIEGSRLLDEKRHRQATGKQEPLAAEEPLDFAFDLLEPTVPPDGPDDADLPEDGAPLVVVDDDPATLGTLRRLFRERGFAVTPAGGGEEALIAIDTLCAAGKTPSLVVDLVMPRMDGTGVYGGIELLELVRGNFPALPVFAMGELADAEGAEGAAKLGVPLFSKPDADGDFAPLADALQRELTLPAEKYSLDLGDELREELGQALGDALEPPEEHLAALPPPEEVAAAASDDFYPLLEELGRPTVAGGVVLLTLRFAARFLNRGVMFMVGGEEIRGAGEFGIDGGDGLASARVRQLAIPRGAPSVFETVIRSGCAYKGGIPPGPWNEQLAAELGRGMEVFVAPIVSASRVVAILYGDNLPELKPVGETDALEIFLEQAGVAMEKAIRSRALKEQGPQEET